MFEKCKDPGKFSIQEFKLQTVKAGQNVYEAPPASVKPENFLFVVSVYDGRTVLLKHRATMGAYADCIPAGAVETISDVKITSATDLVTSDSNSITKNLNSIL